jgi:uncharacterized protein (AIM24 family)
VETELGVAGAIMAAAYMVVEAIKHVAYKKAKNGNGSTFGGVDREMLKEIRAMLTKTDAEGRPMAYTPRKELQLLAEETKEQTAILREIAVALRDK